jgi:hypothetical protein
LRSILYEFKALLLRESAGWDAEVHFIYSIGADGALHIRDTDAMLPVGKQQAVSVPPFVYQEWSTPDTHLVTQDPFDYNALPGSAWLWSGMRVVGVVVGALVVCVVIIHCFWHTCLDPLRFCVAPLFRSKKQ